MATYIIREYRITRDSESDGGQPLSEYTEDFDQVPDKWDIKMGAPTMLPWPLTFSNTPPT